MQEQTGQTQVLGSVKDEHVSGWKGIAAFLDISDRTAQHWFKKYGLPVSQPAGKFSTVWAKTSELTDWLQRKKGLKI